MPDALLADLVEPAHLLDDRFHGDRNLLFEAVANLVDNAVKFTPEGERVELNF